MRNPVVFYALMALGVIVLAIGIYMFAGLNFHGRAYAVMAVGVVCLLAGIGGMVVMRPKI